MARHTIEPRTKKYVRGYGFLSFERNLSYKLGKQLLDAAIKAELDTLKTVSKKVDDKTTDATGEFIGNKIADKVVKPKFVVDENLRGVKVVVLPPEKREEILNELIQVL